MTEKMKVKINEIVVNSICEMANRLTLLHEGWSKTNPDIKVFLWFRGQPSHKKSLIPSIYRTFENDEDSIDEKQKQLIFEFMNRKRHLIHKYQTAPNLIPEKSNSYLWLSIMQHYGYPTCLLDFSEKLIPSIMFALKSYFIEDSSRIHEEDSPCIWVLNPLMLNKATVTRKTLTFINAGSRDYIPSMDQISSGDTFLDDRIAIFSPYLSDRIQAQSGTFVAFPLTIQDANNKVPFGENSLDNHTRANEFLEKWIIADPDKIKLEIELMGFNFSDLFPSISMLVNE